MYFTLSNFDIDFLPRVISRSPYIDDDGDQAEAKIELHPFGKSRSGSHSLVMTVDEADQLARLLWHSVTEARDGRYTENW